MMLHRHFDDTPQPPPPVYPQVIQLRERTGKRQPSGFKAAVYAGTRNLYPHMVTAAKSILCNSAVDRVYFLIEDDEFPYEVADEIECVNVGGQKIFNLYGPNAQSNWTYMVLIRAALSKIFPELDRILSLDVDTLVIGDISELWDMDLGDCLLAMAQEKHAGYRPYGPTYYNAGVVVQDLNGLRETGMDDILINAINSETFTYNEQDAINKYCADYIKELDSKYNDCHICGRTKHPVIVHFVGKRDWATDPYMDRGKLLTEYRALSWADVKAIRKERFGK